MECLNLMPPPEHTKPEWKNSDWFGNKPMEYVKSYFHHVSGFIGMHKNEFYELNIIIDGDGWYYFDDRFYAVSSGSILIIPPNIPHGYRTESSLNIFHALIKCSFFEQYDYELQNIPGYTLLFEIEPFLRSEAEEPLSLRLYKENYNEIVSHLHNLVRLEQSKYAGQQVLKSVLLLYLIGLLSSSTSNIQSYQKHNVTDVASMDIARSMEYIRMNSSKKLTINELASKANMSRSTYLRHFNSVCGCTPMSFINLCRITHAKKLLSYTKSSVSTISQECGFFDSSHFIRIFTSNEGMSPSDFRHLYSGKANYSQCTLCVRHS